MPDLQKQNFLRWWSVYQRPHFNPGKILPETWTRDDPSWVTLTKWAEQNFVCVTRLILSSQKVFKAYLCLSFILTDSDWTLPSLHSLPINTSFPKLWPDSSISLLVCLSQIATLMLLLNKLIFSSLPQFTSSFRSEYRVSFFFSQSFFSFWQHCTQHVALPWLGDEGSNLCPLQWECGDWTSREVPEFLFIFIYMYIFFTPQVTVLGFNLALAESKAFTI